MRRRTSRWRPPSQLMADLGVDHLFFLHRAGGRTWPASVLSLRDVVKALAGPEYIKGQGMHAAATHADGSVPAAVRAGRQTREKLASRPDRPHTSCQVRRVYDSCTNQGIICTGVMIRRTPA